MADFAEDYREAAWVLVSPSDSPGFSACISRPLMSCVSSLSCSGRPTSGGNVPKCMGITCFTRTHRVMIAYRQQRQIGRVEISDNFHITENSRVAGMINRQAARQANDESASFAAINNLIAILDSAGM